jgi:hypothetical protein
MTSINPSSINFVFANKVRNSAYKTYKEVLTELHEVNKKLSFYLFGSLFQFTALSFLYRNGYFSEWYGKCLLAISAAFALTVVLITLYFLVYLSVPKNFSKSFSRYLLPGNMDEEVLIKDITESVSSYDTILEALGTIYEAKVLALKIVTVCFVSGIVIGATGL